LFTADEARTFVAGLGELKNGTAQISQVEIANGEG
jgi:hypothetical protein